MTKKSIKTKKTARKAKAPAKAKKKSGLKAKASKLKATASKLRAKASKLRAKASNLKTKASSLTSKSSRLKKSLKKAAKSVSQKATDFKKQVLNPLIVEDSTASLVLKRIRDTLSPTHLSLQNHTEAHKGHTKSKKSGGAHYAVSVVSEMFSGLDLKARQQWVMSLLKDQIGSTIHAIQMELRSPSEVPLLKDAGAPLRRDFKIKADRQNAPKIEEKTADQSSDSDESEDDDIQ